MHARLPIAVLLFATGACATSPDVAPLALEPDPAVTAPAPAHPRTLRLAIRDEDSAVRLRAAHEAGLLAAAAPRVDAIEAKGALQDPAGDEQEALGSTLAGAFAIESDPEVRRALLWAMGRRGGPIDVLLRAAAAEDDAIRSEALYALGFASGQGARDTAEAQAIAAQAAAGAGAADPEVRAAAAFLLAAIADPAREELAAALARDGDPQVRAFAARALGRVATHPSLLEALLGDTEAQVRVEAARALLEAAQRSRTAGVHGRADLRMEENFARSLDRSAEALALQLRAGAGGRALQPLLALARGDLPPVAAATVRDALAAPATAPRAAGFRQERGGDVILHTGGGAVHLVLEAGAAAARFRALVESGALDGKAIRRVEHGLVLDCDGIDGAAPGSWRRGSIGFGPGGSLLVTFGRAPELDGVSTSFGWVAGGLDRLENLRPGERIERAVLRSTL